MRVHYFDTKRVDNDDAQHYECIRADNVAIGCLLGGPLLDGLLNHAPVENGRKDICAVCPASPEWRRICDGRPQRTKIVVDAHEGVAQAKNNTAAAYGIRQDQQIAAIYNAMGLKKP